MSPSAVLAVIVVLVTAPKLKRVFRSVGSKLDHLSCELGRPLGDHIYG